MESTKKRWEKDRKAKGDTHVSKINIEKHVTTGPIAIQSASGYRTYSHFLCINGQLS